MADRNPILMDAIKRAGGAAAVASALGIKVQAVSQWEECPPMRVHDLERLSGVHRALLRPDLYPKERELDPPQGVAA